MGFFVTEPKFQKIIISFYEKYYLVNVTIRHTKHSLYFNRRILKMIIQSFLSKELLLEFENFIFGAYLQLLKFKNYEQNLVNVTGASQYFYH